MLHACAREFFGATQYPLAHGINGIVIAGGATIGRNVTIFRQVSCRTQQEELSVIGDNVFIGPGAVSERIARW